MNIHPGAIASIKKLFAADELDIARLMATGDLVSPQKYHNIFFLAIRITGTGVAERPSIEEFVHRDPEEYLTPKFLARCNGLPVILNHPDKSLLNSEEYANRNVGSVTLAYFKDDEVWAISRIYDANVIKLLEEKQMSTSPAVLVTGKKYKSPEGETILVEDNPSLLDHIALCEQGVWDKGGEPTGVDQTNLDLTGALAMADESKKNEENEKADAAAKADAAKRLDEKIDMCLKGIGDAIAKFDSLNSRMDSFEKKEEKEDKKSDSEESEEEKEKEKKEEEEEKDSARKDASKKDGDGLDGDEAKRLAADKARRDSEEKKEGREMKDSVSALTKLVENQNATIARLTEMVKQPIPDAWRADLTNAQAKADAVLMAFGDEAPRPMTGESPLDYRRRVANPLKKHSMAWKEIDLNLLPEDAFKVAETQIYKDATISAKAPTDIQKGKMRPITRKTTSGHTITEFVANDAHFVQQFTRSQGKVGGIATMNSN